MVVSHEHRFIFIKTVKTAGTSIEVYLSGLCADDDIFTPVVPPEQGHDPRNHRGLFNPLPELLAARNNGRGIGTECAHTARNLYRRKRFFPHMPAWRARSRLGPAIWNSYFKFCVERNPWDKTLSHYHMLRHRSGQTLELDDYLAGDNFCINYPKYTENEQVIVDRVLRYDKLDDELGEVFSRLRVPYTGTLGVKAKGGYRTDRGHYRDVLNATQRDRIGDIFETEIKLNGFEY